MGQDPGSFSIPEESTELFIQLYMAAIEDRQELSLIERPLPHGPVLVDIDVNYTLPSHVSPPLRGYSDRFLESSVALLMETLQEYLVLETESMRDTFVTTKSAPTLKSTDDGGLCTYKDGYHIYCPGIVADVDTRKQIRNEYLEKMEDVMHELHGHLGPSGGVLVNDLDDIIDKAVISSNGMMMYGSSKPGCPPYALSHVYRRNMGKMVPFRRTDPVSEITPLFTDRGKVTNLLSIRRNGSSPDVCPLSDYGKRQVEAYRASQRVAHEKSLSHKIKSGALSRIRFTEDLEHVRGLVRLLDPHRAEGRQTWMEVGWCLHNIDHRLLPDWQEFSTQAPQYADTAHSECANEWDVMEDRDDGLGLGTLHYWARGDSPDEYRRYMQTSLDYEVRMCAQKLDPPPPEGSGKDKEKKDGRRAPSRRRPINDILHYVARVLHRSQNHQYVCAAFQAKHWFKFDGTRWVTDDGGVSVRTFIANDLADIFYKSAEKYRMLIRGLNTTDEESHARYERLANACTTIAEKMVVGTVKQKLMDEVAEQFFWRNLKYNSDNPELRSKNFEEVLDNKLHLVGMKNGIYDLQMHAMRPGRCEDFMTLSTGLDFAIDNDFHWNHPTVREILHFFDQVQTNIHTRNFVLTLLSTFLSGDTGTEKFHIWVGHGGNGKSKIIELFQETMGEYCGTASITLLTGKRADSSAPTPDLVATKGKRLVVLQEPNENETLQVGKMKELSGGDKITCRGLHKEPIEFKPQFTMVLTCNSLPKVPADDGGTWRRMCVTRFASQFVQNPVSKGGDDAEKEFLIDYTLSSKFSGWRCAFFWILTQYYKAYCDGGRVPHSTFKGRGGEGDTDTLEDYRMIEGDFDEDKYIFLKPGLTEPLEVQRATSQYKKDSDNIGLFIDECTYSGTKAISVTIKKLITHYDRWCRSNSLPSCDRSALQQSLCKRWGDMDSKIRGWTGHAIKEEDTAHAMQSVTGSG